MNDLVQRLRKTPYQWEVGDLCDEAADALEAQAKRIAEDGELLQKQAIYLNERDDYNDGFAQAIEIAAEEILNWGRKDGYEEELVKSIKALKPPRE